MRNSELILMNINEMSVGKLHGAEPLTQSARDAYR